MEEINQAIGLRIKKARLEKGLSREQVARKIDVTQQCIEKYEKGQVDISVKRLTQIAKALGVDVGYFI